MATVRNINREKRHRDRCRYSEACWEVKQVICIVLEVAHTRPEARLFWHDNDLFLGETEGYHVREVQFTPGIHKVTVVDDEGVTLSATLKVAE